MNNILWVDMNKETCTVGPFPQKWARYGGRSLTARILLDSVNPRLHPLGADNLLILANGLLGGHVTSQRLSIGGKSPLTGGIKESNVGGMAAQMLAKCGFRSAVIAGRPQDESKFWIMVIESGRAKLIESAELKGLGNYETCRVLLEKYPKAAVLSIGPAGEYLMTGACISGTDMDGKASRHAGRGGLGAVMGSKGLKAIVIRPDAQKPEKPGDEIGKCAREFIDILLNDPLTRDTFPALGTAMMVDTINGACGFPTYSFRRGSTDEVAKINAAALKHTVDNGGKMGHPCQAGCVIRCSNIYHGRDKTELVAALEYETIGMMGSNLGIFDLDEIARLNWLCDDAGLDTIETGAALGILMDMGLLAFGDSAGAAKLLKEVYSGSPMGRILGAGAETTGRVYGSFRVPTAKGQAMAAYDPRTYKGSGITYATNPMGADHTAGNVLGGDFSNGAVQVNSSRDAQYAEMITDILGICRFTKGPILKKRKELLSEFVAAVNGFALDHEGLMELCREGLRLEAEFNEKAGFGSGQDRLPYYMSQEVLEPCQRVFDVSDEDLDTVSGIIAGRKK